jgi:hypothetical protein
VLAVGYLLAGAVAVVAGVGILWGVGWAVLVGGVLLLALGVLEARGEHADTELVRDHIRRIDGQVPTAAEAAASRRSA